MFYLLGQVSSGVGGIPERKPNWAGYLADVRHMLAYFGLTVLTGSKHR